MKRIIAFLTALLMMVSFAVAENIELNENNFYGTWFVTQIVLDGVAYSYEQLDTKVRIDFNQDGTGVIWSSSSEARNAAWKQNEDGTISFIEEASQEEFIVTFENGCIIMEARGGIMVCARNLSSAINFARVITPSTQDEFDGNYALTYMSGNGYTVAAEKAMETLKELEITSTEIKISNGMVSFLGSEEQQYKFTEDGTLTLDAENETKDLLNVTVFKLEDGGIAANWFGMTFYANKIQ